MVARCVGCEFTSNNYFTIASGDKPMQASACEAACLADDTCGGVLVGKDSPTKNRTGHCYGYRLWAQSTAEVEDSSAYDAWTKVCGTPGVARQVALNGNVLSVDGQAYTLAGPGSMWADTPAVTNITGDLDLAGATVESINEFLLLLESVTGEVQVTAVSGSGGAITAPKLVSIGGGLEIHNNTHLETFSAPKLASSADLDVHNNANLISLSLPLLATVGSDLNVYENNMLPALGLPELASVVGYYYVYDNVLLASVSSPKLTTAAGFYLGKHERLRAERSLACLCGVV